MPMRKRIVSGLLILLGIAVFLEAIPFALLMLSYRRADITFSNTGEGLGVGSSIRILGHVSNGDGGSELAPKFGANSDAMPPFRWLFRWSVETDSTQWDVFETTTYLVGEARVANGRLIGVRPGAVRLVLNVLGRRASQTFLVQAHGVALSADRDSLVLEGGSKGSVVITATSEAGDIPGGYGPFARITDCSPSSEPFDVAEFRSPTRSAGRWEFPVLAHGYGQCMLVFGLADDSIRVPLSVTGMSKMDRLMAKHSGQ